MWYLQRLILEAPVYETYRHVSKGIARGRYLRKAYEEQMSILSD